MSDTPLFSKLTPEQQGMVDSHFAATKRTSQSCESMRDPLEEKYLREVVTKLYASLDMRPPAIYILDSPMACAYMWSHVPQTTADRWRVFHDEFYTHPLSSPIVDVIADGYNAFTRLVEHTLTVSIIPSLSAPILDDYEQLERVGDLVATAITSVENPMQNKKLTEMVVNDIEANVSDA